MYSYVFFIAESKSTVRLKGPAVIIRGKRKKYDFLWFFGIKKTNEKDKTRLTLNLTLNFKFELYASKYIKNHSLIS